MTVHVRPAHERDAAEWARMRQQLWPWSLEEHEREAIGFFRQRDHATEALIAVAADQRAVGFAELSIRSHAEGCLSRGVAYLEGWYVEPDARGQGVGTALVKAAEAWGRARGCTEMASDARINNERGIVAHRSAGFEEVERIVCFRRILSAFVALALLGCGLITSACARGDRDEAAAPGVADRALVEFISQIKAVDNHTHVNSMAADDVDSDALPLDGLPPFSLPVRVRPDSLEWIRAYRALYGYRYDDLDSAHLSELRSTVQRIRNERSAAFPEWVLDQTGTDVMLANRIAMGPGLASPRFRWVSYVDALMLPLSTKALTANNPDRAALFPLEEKLLRRYMSDLNTDKLPATLDAYLHTIVTPTLERQRQGGAVAIKFEAAYLRPLQFARVPGETAARIYSKYVAAGEPPRDEYTPLQDFLFNYIAREAGRLGLAVHIHSFEGAGSFYSVAGSDPLLLESVFNDPDLRSTTFVIVHGGGIYASHTTALLAKPNVYADMSIMPLLYAPATLATILTDWLRQYPEKVLFGTDASPFGPDQGWEVAAWLGTATAREALAVALTAMERNREITRTRAQQIATMVLRTNAAMLYKLPPR